METESGGREREEGETTIESAERKPVFVTGSHSGSMLNQLIWLYLAKAAIALPAHIKVFSTLKYAKWSVHENTMSASRKDDVLNIKWNMKWEEKDEAITRQRGDYGVRALPIKPQKWPEVKLPESLSAFVCVLMKGHWQILMVSTGSPTLWCDYLPWHRERVSELTFHSVYCQTWNF